MKKPLLLSENFYPSSLISCRIELFKPHDAGRFLIFHMEEQTYYLFRLSARIFDVSLVALVIMAAKRIFPSVDFNFLVFFWLYNFIVVVLKGKTLGKFAFSLSAETRSTGTSRYFVLAVRELLLFLLLPVVFINFLNTSPIPIHDRISRTRVIRDES